MAGQAGRVLLALRRRIFEGALPPGERLAEIPLAEALGASRTPVRLALGELEREGLVVPAPGGGFVVRAFTVAEIDDAIDVRGHLEGMAARLVAERGLPRAAARALDACLDEGDRVLAAPDADAALADYAAMNARLHRLVLDAAGNAALARLVEAACALPFAGPSALVPCPALADGRRLLGEAHAEHHRLVGALAACQGRRAEAIAAEHAEHAKRNLRLALRRGAALPGLALIRDAGAEAGRAA